MEPPNVKTTNEPTTIYVETIDLNKPIESKEQSPQENMNEFEPRSLDEAITLMKKKHVCKTCDYISIKRANLNRHITSQTCTRKASNIHKVPLKN